MDDLTNLKVGDYVYYTPNHSSKIVLKKIIRETKTTLIVENKSMFRDVYKTKIRKSDGLEIGSTATGRYGSFDSIFWKKVTNSVIKEYKLQIRIEKIKKKIEEISKIEINKNNIEEFEYYFKGISEAVASQIEKEAVKELLK